MGPRYRAPRNPTRSQTSSAKTVQTWHYILGKQLTALNHINALRARGSVYCSSRVMLSYGGSPMGVLAYVDPSGAPVLLCILANGPPDKPTQSERRGDLSLAWWSRNGRSHLVIGHVPEERAVALAQMIEKQV